MSLLTYAKTPQLVAYVREMNSWQERLDLKGPLPRRWVGRLRRDLEAEATAASVSMEGVPVTVDEVRRILADDPPREVSSADRELVSGYRDAMTYVLRRADDPGFAWQPELLLALHDRVLGGRYESGAGRFRTGPVQIVHAKTGRVVFEPPPAEEVTGAVAQVCGLAMRKSAEHPAILAAWLHVALASVHPFRDGNGRVARVVASLAIYRGGFKRREFTSLEEWWGRHLDTYYGSFECLGPRFATDADVTPFVCSHLQAQLAQVRALDLRERVERQIWQALENILEDAVQPTRLANALWDAFFGRDVTAGYYRSVVDVSAATVTSDLRTAVAAGLLSSYGQRRGRRYAAGERLSLLVGRELGIAVDEGPLERQKRVIVARLTARQADADRSP